MNRGRKIAYRALTVLLSLVVTYGALEVAARIYYARRDGMIRNGFKMMWSPLYASFGDPGSEGLQRNSEYTVTLKANREGYRENTHSLSQTGSVVVLGDSYTWGTGVEEEDRFSDLLAKELGWNILNYGACTAGTINEYAIYRDFAEKKKPRLVILLFYPNDVQNNLWWLAQIGVDKADSEEALLQAIEQRENAPVSWPDASHLTDGKTGASAAFYFLRDRWKKAKSRWAPDRPVREIRLASGKEFAIQEDILMGNEDRMAALNIDTPANRLGWTLTRTALRMLKEACDRDGADFLLVYLPYVHVVHWDVWEQQKKRHHFVVPEEIMDYDRPGRELKRIAEKLKIDFFDLTPALKRAASESGKYQYYPKDLHLTPLGHKTVAEALAGYLRKREKISAKENKGR